MPLYYDPCHDGLCKIEPKKRWDLPTNPPSNEIIPEHYDTPWGCDPNPLRDLRQLLDYANGDTENENTHE